jgi:hypothetical protein
LVFDFDLEAACLPSLAIVKASKVEKLSDNRVIELLVCTFHVTAACPSNNLLSSAALQIHVRLAFGHLLEKARQVDVVDPS